jgi:N-acetylglucosamine-6-phosphate deacetylase
MMRAKTPGRSILVTDAIIAAGQPPGDYMLGDVRVHVDDTGRVGLPNSPYLAGSALALDRAVGNTSDSPACRSTRCCRWRPHSRQPPSAEAARRRSTPNGMRRPEFTVKRVRV